LKLLRPFHVKGSIFEAYSHGETFGYLQYDKEGNVDLNFKYSIDLCCVKCSKMTRTRTHKNSSINSRPFFSRRKVWKTWEFGVYGKMTALQILLKFYEKKSIQVCTNIETHTQWVCNPFLIGRLKIMWSSFFLRKPFLRRRQWWLSTRPDGFVVVVTRLWGWREKINPTLKTF
jgi:hypothetical protein